jgi:hypothetical protein
VVIAIGEETDRKNAANHTGGACGAKTVGEEAFVDKPANNRNAHLSISSENILSVEHRNTRANVNASERLGT